MPNEPKGRKTRHLSVFLRIAVVAAGIIWAIHWLSGGNRWDNLKSVFLRMDMGVFVIVLFIFALGQLIIVLRWWILLRTQSIFISLKAAFRLHFLGLFYNNFMPGAIGGDLIRAWYVTKHTEKKFEAALSVFVDRGIGLLSTLTIAAFFYSFFMRGEANTITFSGKDGFLKAFAEHKQTLLWIIVGIAAGFCAMLLLSKGRLILRKIWNNIYVHGGKAISKLKNAIIIYCSKPSGILSAFVLTVLMQLMVITGFLFLGRNIGITAAAKYYYVFFTLTWVLGSVPISIGGAVVVEGLLAYMFVHFAGVESEAALALALCQRIVWMLTSLPGAAIHAFGAHLPKDFSIDYENPIN